MSSGAQQLEELKTSECFYNPFKLVNITNLYGHALSYDNLGHKFCMKDVELKLKVKEEI
jgi:hypothetical protein